ncbi:hypothetical protein GNI_042450 [Gregarina niphandrodes]|uniref:Uncharacterized protein n=1 Tax=Gregarina niphandrodes TaxID=110365 RepID=A0A023BA16_GRENI|nr:hypothetical protein GNI_042450 [Gregarina niphandrodes]EZG77529.1 hypothetical protein GNI_042450 [Gregarina niphandrodes]|eukprot:XP_011129512.1 hypothetical protein GNI_042450 [Gregarina niphandrodes]
MKSSCSIRSIESCLNVVATAVYVDKVGGLSCHSDCDYEQVTIAFGTREELEEETAQHLEVIFALHRVWRIDHFEHEVKGYPWFLKPTRMQLKKRSPTNLTAGIETWIRFARAAAFTIIGQLPKGHLLPGAISKKSLERKLTRDIAGCYVAELDDYLAARGKAAVEDLCRAQHVMRIVSAKKAKAKDFWNGPEDDVDTSWWKKLTRRVKKTKKTVAKKEAQCAEEDDKRVAKKSKKHPATLSKTNKEAAKKNKTSSKITALNLQTAEDDSDSEEETEDDTETASDDDDEEEATDSE